MTFIILLLLGFLLWPLIKFGWRVNVLRREYNRNVENARREAEAARRRSEAENRPAGWTSPQSAKRKVVSKSEGEYVQWEEVTVEATDMRSGGTQPGASKTTVRGTSTRITDVEWEDV